MKAVLPLFAALALVACKGEENTSQDTTPPTNQEQNEAPKAQTVSLAITGMT